MSAAASAALSAAAFAALSAAAFAALSAAAFAAASPFGVESIESGTPSLSVSFGNVILGLLLGGTVLDPLDLGVVVVVPPVPPLEPVPPPRTDANPDVN